MRGGRDFSLTYEAGREATASRATTYEDLRALGADEIRCQAVTDHYAEGSRQVLHAIERGLHGQVGEEPGTDSPRPPAGPALRFLEGGGERAEAELVAAGVAALIRDGMAPEDIAVAHRGVREYAPLLDAVFRTYDVPVALSRRIPAGHTALGRGVISLLRCAVLDGTADDLLAYLRTPGLLERPGLADRLEAHARRHGIRTAAGAREVWEREHWSLDAVERVAAAAQRSPKALCDRLAAEAAALFASPLRGRAPLLAGAELADARATAALRTALKELGGLPAGLAPGPEELARILDELEVHLGDPPGPGRVTVASPLALRARRVRALFCMGLNEGVFPKPGKPEPFFGDEERRAINGASGLRLRSHEDGLRAERFLLYATVSRPTDLLVCSWRAGDDEGAPAVRSLFVDDIEDLVCDIPRERRELGAVGWPEGTAPTAREAARHITAVAPPAAAPPIAPLADPAVLGSLAARHTWSASAVEAWGACPVKWFVERLLRPEQLVPDPEPMVRGTLAHKVLEQALSKLVAGGGGGLTPERLDEARALLHDALEEHSSDIRISVNPERLRAQLRRLEVDLVAYLDYAATSGTTFVPAGFEVKFGNPEGPNPALELFDGDLRLAGSIDRLDTLGGEAIVYDYKGKTATRSGRWLEDGKLQVALYMLAVRHVLGLEPVGGFYQPLGADEPQPARRHSRGGGPRPRSQANRPLGRRGAGGTARSMRRRGAPSGGRDASRAPDPDAADLRMERVRLPAPGDLQVRDLVSARLLRRRHDARPRRAAVHKRAGGGDRAARRPAAAVGQRRLGQDVRAGRALRADGGRGRDGAGADPRDHVHRQGRRRAAPPDPRSLPGAGARPRRAGPRGCMDLDVPRLLRSRAARAGDPRGAGSRLRGSRRAARPRDPRTRVGGSAGGVPRRGGQRRARPGTGPGGGLRGRSAGRDGSRRLRRPAQPRADPPGAAGGRARGLARGRAVGRRDRAAQGDGGAGAGGHRQDRGQRPPRAGRLRRLAGGAGARELPARSRLEAVGFKAGNTGALKGAGCAEYLAAHAQWLEACDDVRATEALALVDELLGRYADAYAEAKRRRSALDFDDLELMAARVLAESPEVAAGYAERFDRIMVDEFQDTNRVQLGLLEALDRGQTFVVGDQLQSIYGFRHADVEIFRRRQDELDAAGATATLATNFRSRPEILGMLDEAFGPLHGDRYVPFAAGREGGEARGGPAVELLLTEAKGWDADDVPDVTGVLPPASPWRHAEARLVAQRVADLVRREGVSQGDIVVLLRSATDMALYERAIEEHGLSTLASGGRGYWARQQVLDLCAYLGTLANPRDESALFGVLASPLVGLSSDALALLAMAADRGRRWDAVQRELGGDAEEGEPRLAGLPLADRERLAAFHAWFCAERVAAPRLGLDELIERVVERTGYDLHLLGLPGGRRRLANVQKLQRLAAAFEARAGRDVRGLIDLATAELEAEAREPDAPVELGDEPAVRLMTIHAAKGLEFPVVVVADLGRGGNTNAPDLLLRDDRIALRVASLNGGKAPALGYGKLREEVLEAEAREERRVFHVAMTRAQERLILSGAAELADWKEPKPGSPPILWIAPPLLDGTATSNFPVSVAISTPETLGEVLREESIAPAAVATLAEEGVGRPTPAPVAVTAATPEPEQLSLDFTGSPPAPEATVPPAPPGVGSLSFSGLSFYAECPYRWYLRRVLRLPEQDAAPPAADMPAAAPSAGLDPLVRGSIVHELLEDLDLRAPAVPSDEAIADRARQHELELSAEQLADIRGLVAAFVDGPLTARLAGADAIHKEHGFTLALGGHDPLLNGIVDVIAHEPDGTALVLDYKTNPVAGVDLEALADSSYGLQRALYALAALRSGAPAVDVAYLFLERPAEPVVQRFDVAAVPRWRRRCGRRHAGCWRASSP